MTIKKKNRNKVEIDLTGEQGNVFYLIGQASRFSDMMGLNTKKIINDMMSGDYENAIQVFDKHFGHFVTLLR